MLYDPKREKQTKVDPYTLAALIAWLETQNPSQTYDYNNCKGACLLDTYLMSVTGNKSRPTNLHWDICGGSKNYGGIAYQRPWTFGAALDRARSIAAR